jgi:RHS repeat-associated protein
VYANGEAIAEIDANGNIYELHNDHLGTPRYLTSRSTGKIAGEQAFGPYGEELVGTYNGQTLPTGYKPVIGYTGHLNEDLSGLIYMKGRYYSPLWHRFINSDQGVDPRSINR